MAAQLAVGAASIVIIAGSSRRTLRFATLAGMAVATAGTSLCAQGTAAAPAAARDAASDGYVLPDTHVWSLSSESGDEYRILVSLPAAPAPPGGYPVLYVLDGNAHFAAFAESRRLQAWQRSSVGQSIVVGVGYPTDQPYETTRRQIDFTSPRAVPASGSGASAPAGQAPAGTPASAPGANGQERFLDFLLNRLRPEIGKRYAADARRQSLFGHSFGGLFALHVLYTRPDAFQAIIAASPSQWWDNLAILAEERAFAARLAQPAVAGRTISRLLILVGEREERASLVLDAHALARRLEPLAGFGMRTQFEPLAEETHITVPSRAVTTALRFAFAWQ